MEPRDASRDHDEYQSLLGAYALGAVTEGERRVLAAHLPTCEACRAELAELRAAVDALPLALEELEPPPILRYRIQAAVLRDLVDHGRQGPAPPPAALRQRQEAPPAPATPARRSRFVPRSATPWAAAAVVLLAVSLGLLGWNLRLQQDLGRREAVETFALRPSPAAPGASGRLTYLEDRRVLILAVRDLPPLAPGRVYEVWLIRDGAPAPAGVFAASTAEHAVVADPGRYEALAITVEPGPLGSPSPTGEPLAQVPLAPA